MTVTLEDLFEWYLKSAQWDLLGHFVLRFEDGTGERQCEIKFYGIKFMKVLASSAKNIHVDNEIWKLEEVFGSPLLNEERLENGSRWFCQTFADEYSRCSSIPEEIELRHFVLCSDYLDLELLCAGYEMC